MKKATSKHIAQKKWGDHDIPRTALPGVGVSNILYTSGVHYSVHLAERKITLISFRFCPPSTHATGVSNIVDMSSILYA